VAKHKITTYDPRNPECYSAPAVKEPEIRNWPKGRPTQPAPTSPDEIVMGIPVHVDVIREHPLHEKVYGPIQLEDDFIRSVKECGLLEPILVAIEGPSSKGAVLISGRRRLAASRAAGVEYIHAVFLRKDEDFINASSLEAERAVIDANRQRIKTESQKDAEAVALLHIETALAKERQKQGGVKKVRTKSAEPSKAVERVAAAINESSDTVRKRVKIHAAKIPAAERNQQSTNPHFSPGIRSAGLGR
jgi:ParB-like nuclease family protein